MPLCWRPGIPDGARHAHRPSSLDAGPASQRPLRPGNGCRAECFAGVWSGPSSLCPTCHRLSPGCLLPQPPRTPRTGVLRTRRAPAPRAHLCHLSLLSGPSICPSAVASACGGGGGAPVTGGCASLGSRGLPPQACGCWCACVLCPSAQRGAIQAALGPGVHGRAVWAPPQTRGWAHWGLRRNWVPAPGQVWRAKRLPQPAPPWGLPAPAGEPTGVPWVSWPAGGTLPGSEHPLPSPPFTGGETEARGVPGGPGEGPPH